MKLQEFVDNCLKRWGIDSHDCYYQIYKDNIELMFVDTDYYEVQDIINNTTWERHEHTTNSDTQGCGVGDPSQPHYCTHYTSSDYYCAADFMLAVYLEADEYDDEPPCNVDVTLMFYSLDEFMPFDKSNVIAKTSFSTSYESAMFYE